MGFWNILDEFGALGATGQPAFGGLGISQPRQSCCGLRPGPNATKGTGADAPQALLEPGTACPFTAELRAVNTGPS